MRELVLAAFREALLELDPRALARAAARGLPPSELWAVGKAARAMAAGVRESVAVTRELVVGPDDAGHPTPDRRSRAAGAALLERARSARDPVVLALSGGASALAVAPAWGLTLDEKVAATAAVAAAGASIRELNAVRKHLSELKGGRLAAACAAPIVTLILSDVTGDDPSVVGSGPTAPDPTTFADARDVVARTPGVPARVVAALAAGHPETPKIVPGADLRVLAGPDDLGRAMARALARRRLDVTVEPRVACGVGELARRLLEHARAGRAAVLSGEPVIALPSRPGRGGRAQQTALLVARDLDVPAVVLCLASDGRDGPTDAAGGLVDEGTRARIGPDLDRAILACDAGPALASAGDLITTGPTGTNLCDVYVVLPKA